MASPQSNEDAEGFMVYAYHELRVCSHDGVITEERRTELVAHFRQQFDSLSEAARRELVTAIRDLNLRRLATRDAQDKFRDHAGKDEFKKSKPNIALFFGYVQAGIAEHRHFNDFLSSFTTLIGIYGRLNLSQRSIYLMTQARDGTEKSNAGFKNTVIRLRIQYENAKRCWQEEEKKRLDERRQALAGDFMSQPLDENVFRGNWHGVLQFGSGVNTAGLWICQDSQGNITDRVVRKSSVCHESFWNNPIYWHGDVQDPQNRRSNEEYLTQKCDAACSGLFAAIRCAEQDSTRGVLTIYSEYCGFGDVYRLMQPYKRDGRPIPEPFLWMLFLKMTEACLVMAQGSVDAESSDWMQIIHRDIKPANIFLDNKSEAFPLYPQPKLGDFGIAIETNESDPTNPASYNGGAGTPPYKAPEQTAWNRRRQPTQGEKPVPEQKLLSWTNVYGLGMVMYQLVHPHIIKRDDARFYIDVDDSERWRIDSWAQDRYSTHLLTIILACIVGNPQNRMKLGRLRDLLKTAIETGDNSMDAGMRSYITQASLGTQAMGTDWDLELEEEKYRIGMANAVLGPEGVVRDSSQARSVG